MLSPSGVAHLRVSSIVDLDTRGPSSWDRSQRRRLDFYGSDPLAVYARNLQVGILPCKEGLGPESEREAARYRRLHRNWLSVLEHIRSLDGLRDFLLPTPFDKLQKAAARGTIVILNASDSGCAALIVTLSNVASG
jgi:hypothetical protein